MDLSERYLDLLANTLSRYDGCPQTKPAVASSILGRIRNKAARIIATPGAELTYQEPFNPDLRRQGMDWPVYAETMIGLERLANLRTAVRTVVTENIPGDLVETGAWRGGASIFMRLALDVYGDKDRTVWVADSFEGLPPPDMERYPQDAGMNWHTFSELAVSLQQVKANFAKYGALDDRVRFLKGWFKDTLPTAPIERIAVLRLDGDLYASTMDALKPLYDKVSPGGFVIVDDYGMVEDTCRRAIHDFRSERGITDEIARIDKFGAYWRKTQEERSPAKYHLAEEPSELDRTSP